MSTKNKSSYKNLMASISKLNTQETQQIYVPSLRKNVPFAPLTVKQQKELLATGVDAQVENLSFVNKLNDIIKFNCKSNERILLTDRALIVLQMRSKSIGNEINVIDDEGNSHPVDLDKHINYCINSAEIGENEFELTVDVVTLKCRTPDLARDMQFNKQFTKKIKSTGKNNIELTDVIGEIYIHELIKYVTSITVEEDNIDFENNVNVDQMIEIFESMPMKISTKLAEAVKNSRSYEQQCVTPVGLPEDVTISLDAALFTTGE